MRCEFECGLGVQDSSDKAGGLWLGLCKTLGGHTEGTWRSLGVGEKSGPTISLQVLQLVVFDVFEPHVSRYFKLWRFAKVFFLLPVEEHVRFERLWCHLWDFSSTRSSRRTGPRSKRTDSAGRTVSVCQERRAPDALLGKFVGLASAAYGFAWDDFAPPCRSTVHSGGFYCSPKPRKSATWKCRTNKNCGK